jgi:hypothetical protein
MRFRGSLKRNCALLLTWRQTLAAFGATACQNFAAVAGSHSAAETVLIATLSLMGLKGSFHCINLQ